MLKGLLFIISAPSGTGKSSLIKVLLETNLVNSTRVSISHTTRLMRPGEHHGKHYYFISISQFKKMILEKKFLEYAKVFNNYYGTSKKEVNKSLLTGLDVFLDIDWQGAQQVRSIIPESKSIFIFPPSKKELYKRLQKRGQDNDLVIKKRMSQATSDMQHYIEYDYLIVNDDFNRAISDLSNIVKVERLSKSYQIKKNKRLISKLLLK